MSADNTLSRLAPAGRVITQVYTRRPCPPPAPTSSAPSSSAASLSSTAAAPVAPARDPPLPKGAVAVPLVSNQHAMSTRAKIGFWVPAFYHAALLFAVPKTYRSALADPNWRAAMVEKHNALLQNHT